MDEPPSLVGAVKFNNRDWSLGVIDVIVGAPGVVGGGGAIGVTLFCLNLLIDR